MRASVLFRDAILLIVLFISSDLVLSTDLRPASAHSHSHSSSSSSNSLPEPQGSTTATTVTSKRIVYASNHDRLHALYKNFMEAFMFPNNSIEAKTINSKFFAEDVRGRVDVTNNFEGRELNTEYVFGLFAKVGDNKTFSLLPVPIAWEERAFISSGNMASTSTLITFEHIGSGTRLPEIIDIFIRWNDKDEIDQYDATFKRYAWAFDVTAELLVPSIAASENISVADVNATVIGGYFQQNIAKSVCNIADTYCTGENKQYDSYDSCIEFMNSIPLGKAYQLGQDTALCRMLHQEMVTVRPAMHCSHIGPSGGDMCIKRDYAQVTEEIFFKQLFIEE